MNLQWSFCTSFPFEISVRLRVLAVEKQMICWAIHAQIQLNTDHVIL